MDADFIKRTADVVKLEIEQRRRRDNVRLLDADLLKARAPAFWEGFLAELGSYIDAFNAEFPGDRERHVKLQIEAQKATVSNSAYPHWAASCFLNIAGHQLEILYKDGLMLDGLRPGETIRLVICPDGAMGFLNKSTDQVIQLFLGRVFQGANGKA
jgi:hypothetical protein